MKRWLISLSLLAMGIIACAIQAPGMGVQSNARTAPAAAVVSVSTVFSSPPIAILDIIAPAAIPLPGRHRIQSTQDYIVFDGMGRANDLARFDPAVVQPETLTDS